MSDPDLFPLTFVGHLPPPLLSDPPSRPLTLGSAVVVVEGTEVPVDRE